MYFNVMIPLVLISIIGLPFLYYFYVVKLKNYNILNNNLKRYVFAFFSSILTLTILISITSVVISEIVNPIIKSKEFNSEIWKKEKYERYKMVYNLMSKKLLIGKNRDEVVEILGSDFSEGGCSKNSINYLVYDPDEISFLDHEAFIICFDDEEVVLRVELFMI